MSTKKIVLTSFEGERFELDDKVAMQMRTIERLIGVRRELAMTGATTASPNTIDDDFLYAPIEVSKVNGKILSKAIEYCQKHVENCSDNLGFFDADFVGVDQDTLFDLMVAADCLGIPNLLDLTIAETCKGKSKEEICDLFFYLFN